MAMPGLRLAKASCLSAEGATLNSGRGRAHPALCIRRRSFENRVSFPGVAGYPTITGSAAGVFPQAAAPPRESPVCEA